MADESGGRGEDDRRSSALRRRRGGDTHAMAAIAGRVVRIEDGLNRVRDQMAHTEDVRSVGRRIDGLTARIDVLTSQIAASNPRMAMAEAAIAELRTTVAPRTELAVTDRRLTELGVRVDGLDQGQTNRAAILSTQVVSWLVAIIILVMGALVTYALAH